MSPVDVGNRGGATLSGARPDARARVFAAMAQSGPISRAELARRSALAPSTVGTVISELQAEGLVVEPTATLDPPDRPTMGRPPVLVALHRKAGVALGIDLGHQHVRVALVDLSHAVIAERVQQIDRGLPAGDAIPLIARLVRQALADGEVDDPELRGVGMGFPGPVHRQSGTVLDSTILPGWVDVHGGQAMSAALGHHVEIENDANLGALSEWMWGAGRGADNLVYLKLATGIGAGLILNGEPYVGTTGVAGEIGHTVIEPGGPICKCGNRGCIATLAGSPAILAALRPSYGDRLTLTEAITLALAGDPGCKRAIEDAARSVGVAVATLCNLLNPTRIVVGGELSAAGALLLDPVKAAVGRAAIRSAADGVEVVQGQLGERAQVLGAVALILRQARVTIQTRPTGSPLVHKGR